MPTIFRDVPAAIVHSGRTVRTKNYKRIMHLVGRALRDGRIVDFHAKHGKTVRRNSRRALSHGEVIETISVEIETPDEKAAREAAGA